MSQNKNNNGAQGRASKQFSAPNVRLAIKELIKAENSGDLDNLDSFVTITVVGGDMSPELKQYMSDKPV